MAHKFLREDTPPDMAATVQAGDAEVIVGRVTNQNEVLAEDLAEKADQCTSFMGSPVLATEHIEDYCELSPTFFSPPADYFLRVIGDSMKEIGILDGDLLAVHNTSTARDGQIVVARIEDEVTVKRLKRAGQHTLKLLPENADYEPIVVDLRRTECAIEGISVGVIRQQ